MAHSNILVICEGPSEQDIYTKMANLFVGGGACKCYTFKTNLYELCDKLVENGLGVDIQKDEFDILTILKDFAKTQEDKDILSNKYESILLCFDVEFQASQYDESKLNLMVETFDNDSEQGQLILNYPMIESLYDHKNTWESYKDRDIPLEGLTSSTYSVCLAKRGIRSPQKGKCLYYTNDQFRLVLDLNIRKACYILGLDDVHSTEEFLRLASQKNILQSVKTHLYETQCIWIQNTSIFFLLDYIKYPFANN